jgi:signal transduction histidine kinase
VRIETERRVAARPELAKVIDMRRDSIVRRWLEHIREDQEISRVPLTDLKDGVDEYLQRLSALLRNGGPIDLGADSVWQDVAQAHALNRVRLGFDVGQMFHELVVLRRIITDEVRQSGTDGEELEIVADLFDPAIMASIRRYVDSRDYSARQSEATRVAFITHELRNPLTTALLAADKLGRKRGSDTETVDRLTRSLKRMAHLIDGILLTERLESGAVHPKSVDLTLGALLDELLDGARQTTQAKGLELSAHFERDAHVRLDPALTTSALNNLIDNAVKYTDRGRVTIEAQIIDQGQLEIHVRDTGPGLSPDELSVVFEPYVRIHSSKPGSGLGLAIARRAVEAQGGTIHVESDPNGVGSHFWLRLPSPRH